MLKSQIALVAIYQVFVAVYGLDVNNENDLAELFLRNETIFVSGERNESMFISVVQYVKSHGYPFSCCESAVFIITASDSFLLGDCLHIAFDDLDLPMNSSIKVFEVAENSKTNIFEYTSKYSTKERTREAVNSIFLCDRLKTCHRNSSLAVILRHQGGAMLSHIGFKARLWTSGQGSLVADTENLPMLMLNHSATVSCQLLTTVNSGQQIRQKIASSDGVIKYVWIVKLPTDVPQLDDFVVFMRIISTEFDGDLKVQEGTRSDSSVVLQKSITWSDESLLQMNFEAEMGFRIGVRVRLNVTDAYFDFITGIRRITQPSVKNQHLWMVCHNSSWIIPEQYRCDDIPHCPMGEDEESAYCRGNILTRTDKSSLSFLKWLIPLIGGFVIFGLVLFLLKICLKRKHQRNQCHGTEITRPLRSGQVPLLHLSSHATNGQLPGRSSSTHQQQFLFGEIHNASHIDISSVPRTVPIPIVMDRNVAVSIPIIVRPQVHRDGRAFPPSYEEATADQSFGSDSLEDLEEIPEYHPPSYEDASQGKAGVVSSWVSSHQISSHIN